MEVQPISALGMMALLIRAVARQRLLEVGIALPLGQVCGTRVLEAEATGMVVAAEVVTSEAAEVLPFGLTAVPVEEGALRGSLKTPWG